MDNNNSFVEFEDEMNSFMDNFISEDVGDIGVVTPKNHEDKGDFDIIMTNDLTDDSEETRPNYDVYLSMFRHTSTDLKDYIIKQAMRSMFNDNPKFRKDDSLITSVYNAMKSYSIEYKRHVFLDAPTGSGKTIIAFGVNYCFTFLVNRIAVLMREYTKNDDGDYTDLEDYIGYVLRMEDNNIHLFMAKDGTIGMLTFDEENKPKMVKKLDKKIQEYDESFDLNSGNKTGFDTYLLTSSKALQEQLEKDIDGIFKLDDYYAMLKGSSNYECTLGTKENKEYTSFADRSCQGMNKFEKSQLECIIDCAYLNARGRASESQTAVLNYHFFLNALRSEGFYFKKRDLTIADEGHLLPSIVTNIFNLELTMYPLNRLLEIMDLCNFNFNLIGHDRFKIASTKLGICYKYFTNKVQSSNDIAYVGLKIYRDNLHEAVVNFFKLLEEEKILENALFIASLSKKYAKFMEMYQGLLYGRFIDAMKGRMEDLNFESNQNDFKLNLQKYDWFSQMNNLNSQSNTFNHIFRDLNESNLVSENFIEKTNFTLQLSATFIDMQDHTESSMGITNDDNYKNLKLPQIFDYKNSPIYLTRSGFLNYNNFDSYIGDVIADTILIATEMHDGEKGIIHTASTRINNLLMDEVQKLPSEQRNRFLFYSTSEEKEQCIKMMYMTKFPYIICGYSLYEGLDLKDDLGRFNILMKVPFGGQSDYTKAKMQRYPKWYKNDTIQKVCQAIGRTNRSKEDQSTVYLLDSMFDKFRHDLPSYIRERIITKRL